MLFRLTVPANHHNFTAKNLLFKHPIPSSFL
jgi:hypothetical protein